VVDVASSDSSVVSESPSLCARDEEDVEVGLLLPKDPVDEPTADEEPNVECLPTRTGEIPDPEDDEPLVPNEPVEEAPNLLVDVGTPVVES